MHLRWSSRLAKPTHRINGILPCERDLAKPTGEQQPSGTDRHEIGGVVVEQEAKPDAREGKGSQARKAANDPLLREEDNGIHAANEGKPESKDERHWVPLGVEFNLNPVGEWRHAVARAHSFASSLGA